jgi:hypothetical protein
MAVFTEVSEQQATDLLTQLSIGELVSLQGINIGIDTYATILKIEANKWMAQVA